MSDAKTARTNRAMLALLLVGLVGLQGCQAMRAAAVPPSERTSLVADAGPLDVRTPARRARAGRATLEPVCSMGGFGLEPGWVVALMGLLVIASPFLIVYAVLSAPF